MILRGGLLALSLFLLAGAAAAQHSDHQGLPSVAGSREYEISSLAQNLDNTVKVCGEQAIRAASRQNVPGKREKAAVERGLLKFASTPPPALAAAANPKYGAARFGQWFDPHAAIWIIAYETAPTCRVLVSNSEWAIDAVPELERLVQVGDFWKPRVSNDPVPPDMSRLVFVGSVPDSGRVAPLLTITSRPQANAEGQVQVTMSVSLVNKEEK